MGGGGTLAQTRSQPQHTALLYTLVSYAACVQLLFPAKYMMTESNQYLVFFSVRNKGNIAAEYVFFLGGVGCGAATQRGSWPPHS